MSTNIDICNSALDKLGVENITALNDGTKAANLCSRNYDLLRRKLLRTHWWNFATKRVTLTAETTTPTWGFSSEFLLPSDNIRLLQLENTDTRYREEDGKLLVQESGDTINILYVYDQDDVDSMSDTFKESLAYLLASEIAYPLLQSRTVSTDMYNKFKVEVAETRTIDSQISSNDGLQGNAWLDSRMSSYRTSGDRSYYWDN